MKLIPPTSMRVERRTAEHINQRIARAARRRIDDLAEHPEQASRRLRELDEEWDIERMIEANASTLILAGLALGATVNRRWYILPAVVASFLLQHAIQGWCPPVPIFRRMGLRTMREIDLERDAVFEILRRQQGSTRLAQDVVEHPDTSSPEAP